MRSVPEEEKTIQTISVFWLKMFLYVHDRYGPHRKKGKKKLSKYPVSVVYDTSARSTLSWG